MNVLQQAKKQLAQDKRSATLVRNKQKRKELAENRERSLISNQAYKVFQSLNGKKIKQGKLVVKKSEKFRWPFDICQVFIKYNVKDSEFHWLFSVGYTTWEESTIGELICGPSYDSFDGIKISYEDYSDFRNPRRETSVEYRRYNKNQFAKEIEEWLVTFIKKYI